MFELHTIDEADIPMTSDGVTSNILGTFEGKSGDGEVTNENGLDISTPVWKNVFDSDEFKYGIEHGYYIGYLGHPEDPGCQDFEHACIILRDAHIDDDGQVYAKVDLIDTPVGRIVKSFIDAGVEFGLSVRGAGDVIDNSVDPDTFCFRGFDLVAFPAYKDAIPTFTEIAASTNIEDIKKYKKICASVNKNIKDVDDIRSLEIIQSQFNKDSDEYRSIEKQIKSIQASSNNNSLYKSKLDGIMNLYLDSIEENTKLKNTVKDLSNQLNYARRKIASSTKIYDDQIDKYKKHMNTMKADSNDLSKKYKICTDKLSKVEKELVEANNKISKVSDNNLIYQRKIEKYQTDADNKDSVIASLKSEKLETVKNSEDNEKKISNLDSEVAELKSDVTAALKLVSDYQDAYSELYASILGVTVDNLSINNMTSVQELRDAISASTSVIHNNNSISGVEEIVDEVSEDNIIVV